MRGLSTAEAKFAFVQRHEKATQRIAAAFLHDLVAAVPYTIHTVLTDNGIQFADNHPVDEEAEAKAAYWATQDRPRIYRWHSFGWACEQTKIEHRLTRPHQAALPVDERSSRAHGPNHQGRHAQGLPLRQP